MAGKLDQSLDDILKDRKTTAGRGGTLGRRRAATAAKAAVTATIAPAGGVRKKTKGAAAARKTAPTIPNSGDSKIIVSNLPEDVTETQIKDYFGRSVGPVKKVLLTYGPNGRSRGISTIIFSKPGSAFDAAKQLNGVKVDNRPMKVEVIMGAQHVPDPEPAKALGDRIAQPKKAAAQPKSAAANNATTDGATRGAGRRRGRGGRNTTRRPKKTAEQLDADMQDYFGGDANGAAGGGDTAMATDGGAVQPGATQGGEGMDEIM